MKRINIGGKISASAVAMGCMRITDAGKDAGRVIETALECGIDWFDHADIYGGGECEKVFGDYLAKHKDIRDKITIQTKCGIRKGFYDFSKEHIIESCEASLKRLKTDYVDVLLLHRPDTLMEPEKVAEAFSRLESAGKVKYFGVSNHNIYQIKLLKTAVKQPLIIDQLQLSIPESGLITSGLNVNMKNEESVMHDGGLLEYTRIKNMTIQAWSPFQQGFIKKPFIGDTENFGALNERLNELAEKYSADPTAIASAWLIRHPANIQVISGSVNPNRIKSVCRGADIVLTREDWYSVYLAAGFKLP